MRKGQIMSSEQKEKIRQSNLGKKHNIFDENKKNTFVKGVSSWNKGKPITLEWKEKLRQAKLGKKLSMETKHRMSLSAKKDEDNHKWKGDDVGYRALHLWVERQLGKPTICEHCGLEERRMHWANKSHKYKREVSDWMRLCPKCHKQYDLGYLTTV